MSRRSNVTGKADKPSYIVGKEIRGLIFLLIAIILGGSLLSYHPADKLSRWHIVSTWILLLLVGNHPVDYGLPFLPGTPAFIAYQEHYCCPCSACFLFRALESAIIGSSEF